VRLARFLPLACLLACEPQGVANEAGEPSLPRVEMRFLAYGASSLGFHSSVAGGISLLELDDPPVVIGELALERMQLFDADRLLVAAETGRWPFLAHAGERGTIASVRVVPSMPGEAAQLLRLALSELRPATHDGLGQDEVQVGLVDTWQASTSLFGVRAVLCLRRSTSASPADSTSATLSLHDTYGPWWLVAISLTRVDLPDAPLHTANVLFVRREQVAALAPNDAQLGATIEDLSTIESVSLADAMPSTERLDELRREAESWPDLVARIRNDDVEHGSVVTRIAAHLRADDKHVDELVALLDELPSESDTRGRMLAALGECGTVRCQAVLVERLDAAEHDMLGVLARVDAPTSDTLDAVLARAASGDVRTRELAGMLLHHHAQHDAEDALARARALISPPTSCAELDAWLGLLGNAGLVGSDAWLLDCLAPTQPVQRRAAALAALRRIPGEAVTRVLLEHVGDTDEALRDASLRALARRGVSEADLESLAGLELATWRASSLQLLLDLLAAARPSSAALRGLVQRVAASADPDAAARARELLDLLDSFE
jgi:hypothetical protein